LSSSDESLVKGLPGRRPKQPLQVRDVRHQQGIEWFDAPIPRRWHRCRTWSRGVVNGRLVERCACGAIRLDGYGGWMDRNDRRKKRDPSG
jgi:hypothetical protein